MIPLVAKLAIGLGAGALFFGIGAKQAGASTKKPMPPWLLSQYQNAKANAQTNPQALDNVAATLRANGYPAEADELEALARTRAIADSPNTTAAEKAVAAAITEVAKIQAQTPVLPSGSTGVVPFVPAPASNTVIKPTTVALPTKPAVVAVPVSPNSPVEAPYVLNAQQTLAKKVGDHLNLLVKASGGVARAKGKEDKALIITFQKANGLLADGLYGPKSGLMLGRYWGDVPIIFYWKKGTIASVEVPKYRAGLLELSSIAEKGNAYDHVRSKMLLLAMNRETGQGYGTGTRIAPGVGMTSAEIQQMQQQVAAAYFKTV